jgi:type VI protein secretion system component Hcp
LDLRWQIERRAEKNRFVGGAVFLAKVGQFKLASKAMAAQGVFPSEKIKVNYGKIEWRYTKQKRAGGGISGNIGGGWDRQRNCKV